MTTIIIKEAQYVDARTNTNKFYRTFVLGTIWLTQYGRNGTAGTFTKPVQTDSHDKALAEAAKKLNTKLKSGYRPHRSGTVTLDDHPESSDYTWLDELAVAIAAGSGDGGDYSDETTPVPVTLNLAVLDDLTDDVITHLGRCALDPTTEQSPAATAPLQPMLAAAADPEDLNRFIEDPYWVMQYKYDGDRVVIVVDSRQITVLNRQGQNKTRGISPALLAPFSALHRGRWVFDGELVDRHLVVFDLIEAAVDGTAWIQSDTSYHQRHIALNAVTTVIFDDHENHSKAMIADEPYGKSLMIENAWRDHREGVILRDRSMAYEQGRRSSGLLKHKFTHTADLVVTSVSKNPASAWLAAHDDTGALTDVGSASVIGKGSINAGEVWEVEFLYVIDPEHPRMVQPRLLRKREDKAPKECTLDQFAHTGTNRKV